MLRVLYAYFCLECIIKLRKLVILRTAVFIWKQISLRIYQQCSFVLFNSLPKYGYIRRWLILFYFKRNFLLWSKFMIRICLPVKMVSIIGNVWHSSLFFRLRLICWLYASMYGQIAVGNDIQSAHDRYSRPIFLEVIIHRNKPLIARSRCLSLRTFLIE